MGTKKLDHTNIKRFKNNSQWLLDRRRRSSGALGYTVGEIQYQITDADSDLETICSPCNQEAAAPAASIQEIDYDDLFDNLRNAVESAIESARATNPNVNAGFYFEGRIQTLAFNPDKVYACESE